MTLDEPDGSAHAQAANRFGADVYLGLAPTDDAVTIAYYAVPGFESVGGRRLAHLLHDRLAASSWPADDGAPRDAPARAARDPHAGGAVRARPGTRRGPIDAQRGSRGRRRRDLLGRAPES